MKDIISFIISPESKAIFQNLKLVFIIVVAISLAGIVILLLKNTWLKRRFLEDLIEIITYKPFGTKKTFKQWVKITKRLESGKEAEYKLAIIEVDSLLDDILKKMGYSAETMEDKLRQLDLATLPDIDRILEVHKIRNNVVHDPDYHLTLDQAKEIIAIYEKALRDLEMF